MKVTGLKLQNFRAYHDEVSIDIDDLTVFVGRNDAGKSTLLEALDIFFNDKEACVKIEADDLNKTAESNEDYELSISVSFSDVPDEVDIDAGNRTTLQAEHLLNENSDLEIKKVYRNGKLASVFLVANHPTSTLSKDLMQHKQAALKKIINENSIECSNQSINAVMRAAIRAYEGDLLLTRTEIDSKSEDTKKIWDNLQRYMPVYALFQSDRSNSDQDNEVQNPMKLAVKEIMQDPGLQDKFEEIFKEVESRTKEIADQTLEKLKEMNPEVARQLSPKLPRLEELKWADVFKSIGITSDGNIKLNKRGSGVKRLVLLNFFRAEADRRKKLRNVGDVIYAIEEPETSQHPEHQKMLINALIALSESDNTQVVLTTHSPALGQMLPVKSLKLVENQSVNSGENIYGKIARSLGVMPNYNKIVMCVEGSMDVKFIKNINSLIPELKSILDLDQFDISLMPLRGSNLIDWVQQDYLKNSSVVQFHLYDKDIEPKTSASQTYVDEVNNRSDQSTARLTKLREIENYLPQSLIEAELSISLGTVTDWSNEDVPKLVASKLGVDENVAKSRLNGQVSKKLTKNALEQAGTWDEVKGWFEELKQTANTLGSEND